MGIPLEMVVERLHRLAGIPPAASFRAFELEAQRVGWKDTKIASEIREAKFLLGSSSSG